MREWRDFHLCCFSIGPEVDPPEEAVILDVPDVLMALDFLFADFNPIPHRSVFSAALLLADPEVFDVFGDEANDAYTELQDVALNHDRVSARTAQAYIRHVRSQWIRHGGTEGLQVGLAPASFLTDVTPLVGKQTAARDTMAALGLCSALDFPEVLTTVLEGSLAGQIEDLPWETPYSGILPGPSPRRRAPLHPYHIPPAGTPEGDVLDRLLDRALVRFTSESFRLRVAAGLLAGTYGPNENNLELAQAVMSADPGIDPRDVAAAL